MDPDWGDVPAWFEAIGTVGAFLFAFGAFYGDRARRRREHRERFARGFAVWLDGGSLWYVNLMMAPIRDVKVQISDSPFEDDVRDIPIRVLPPAAEPTQVAADLGGGSGRILGLRFVDQIDQEWFRDETGYLQRLDLEDLRRLQRSLQGHWVWPPLRWSNWRHNRQRRADRR